MMNLTISKDVTIRVPRRELTGLFERVMNSERCAGGRGGINLVFSTDHHLRALNRRFLNRQRTTDVLAFPLSTERPDASDEIVGEIYISVPVARRQADSYGVTLTSELLRLFCHGLLHLLGYDHKKAADATVMRAREDCYLRRPRRL
ncbi:MAG TPA: rRNA maturation RNase YbeY [Candidatus Deferrimicrobium sp.]|nr:rRNA maturation RNase YbeY [Candidatus Deferrimicrobium sp.]